VLHLCFETGTAEHRQHGGNSHLFYTEDCQKLLQILKTFTGNSQWFGAVIVLSEKLQKGLCIVSIKSDPFIPKRHRISPFRYLYRWRHEVSVSIRAAIRFTRIWWSSLTRWNPPVMINCVVQQLFGYWSCNAVTYTCKQTKSSQHFTIVIFDIFQVDQLVHQFCVNWKILKIDICNIYILLNTLGLLTCSCLISTNWFEWRHD